MTLSKPIIITGAVEEIRVAPIFLLPLIPLRFWIKGCKVWLGAGRRVLFKCEQPAECIWQHPALTLGDRIQRQWSFQGSRRAAVPNLFGIRDRFCGRQFFHGRGQGRGKFQAVIRAMGSDGERWVAADEASLTHLPLTSCCVAGVPNRGVGDPYHRLSQALPSPFWAEFSGTSSFLQGCLSLSLINSSWHLTLAT